MMLTYNETDADADYDAVDYKDDCGVGPQQWIASALPVSPPCQCHQL